MNYSTRVSRSRFAFGKSGRALVTTTVLIVGVLVVLGTFFSASVSTPKVAAAQAEFAGGATSEMLAYALNFGEASDFAVFGGRNLRNRGNSVFRGRVGSGGGVEGMPEVVPENYGQAKKDMQDAMNWISQLPCERVDDPQLGGKTFGPGVYCLPSSQLSGEVTLSGAGDSNARFVFYIKGTSDLSMVRVQQACISSRPTMSRSEPTAVSMQTS